MNGQKQAQLTIFRCAWCGRELPAGRTDRKYHDRCRQPAYRWRRAAALYSKRVNEALELASSYFGTGYDLHYQTIERLMNTVRKIQTMLDEQGYNMLENL